MKILKKKFLFLTLSLLLAFSLPIPASASNSDEKHSGTLPTEKHTVKYLILASDGAVREEGVLPTEGSEIIPYASFGPRTLYNGETMLLLPDASPTKGFWMAQGTYMVLRFSLNRTAAVYTGINRSTGGTIIKSWSGTTNGRYISATAPTTDYYSGRIRNSSSEPFTVTGASFSF